MDRPLKRRLRGWRAAYVSVLFMGCTAQLDTYNGSNGIESGGSVDDCTETIPVELEERFASPDVLLVVDKSQSMQDNSNRLPNGLSRWNAMTEGVSNLLSGYPDVHFGLSLFPGSSSVCSRGSVDVPPSSNTVSSVLNRIDGASPGGQTPTAATLREAFNFYSNQTSVNPDGRYVLLATDGNDSCGGTPALVAQELSDIGVKTYVIGFSDGAIGFEELRQIAEAGGTENFHGIGSGEQLNESLSEILGVVSEPSCTLHLNGRPVVENGISIEIGGSTIGNGDDGWFYHAETNTIDLKGSACRDLRSSNDVELRVDLGCGSVVIE